MERRAWIWNCK